MRPVSRLLWTSLLSPCGLCRSGEIGQRVRAVEARAQVGGDPGVVDLAQRGRPPVRLAVLVHEQRAHALGEVGVDTAANRGLVLEAEDVGQREVPGRAL